MRQRYTVFLKSIFLFAIIVSVSFTVRSLPAAEESAAEAGSVGTIKDYLDQALPANENRRIVYDELTGVLTITDTPSNQAMAKELIKLWDIGSKQVRIQARFVEVAVNDIGELGVEWLWRRTSQPNAVTGVVGATGVTGAGAEDINSLGVNAVAPPVTDSPASAGFFGTSNETSGLGLEIGKSMLSGSSLMLYIKALEEQDKANLLSSPSVTTLSGQMANIQLANILPYASDFERTNIGTTATPIFVEKYKVTEKVTGITLEVTPKVAGDSKIVTMDILPEVTVVVKQLPISASADFPTNLGYPLIDTRRTQTSVVVRSGETVVIGGLIREDETITERKTPFLGDIPLLGNLFKTKHVNRTKKNLLIFLTATILDSKGEPIL